MRTQPPKTKKCKYPNCPRTLREENESGYCYYHYTKKHKEKT